MHKLLGVLSSNQLWSITNRNGNAIVKLLNTDKENAGLYDNGRYHIKLLGK